MPIVTDAGFRADPLAGQPRLTPAALESGAGETAIVEIDNDIDVVPLSHSFDRLDAVVVAFPNFADGRGFSLARRLRSLGYRGRLRAKGHLIADQYAMARSCGFDEVEIDETLAARQPEAHWLDAAERAAAPSAHALRARPAFG